MHFDSMRLNYHALCRISRNGRARIELRVWRLLEHAGRRVVQHFRGVFGGQGCVAVLVAMVAGQRAPLFELVGLIRVLLQRCPAYVGKELRLGIERGHQLALDARLESVEINHVFDFCRDARWGLPDDSRARALARPADQRLQPADSDLAVSRSIWAQANLCFRVVSECGSRFFDRRRAGSGFIKTRVP
jgi:hypothetical protein